MPDWVQGALSHVHPLGFAEQGPDAPTAAGFPLHWPDGWVPGVVPDHDPSAPLVAPGPDHRGPAPGARVGGARGLMRGD